MAQSKKQQINEKQKFIFKKLIDEIPVQKSSTLINEQEIISQDEVYDRVHITDTPDDKKQ